MPADHAPVRQARTNVCVCGELVADHRWFDPNEESDAHQWILDHPAETVALLTEAGVLVRADCDECNNRGVTYETPQGLDGWPSPCPVCDGGNHPLYRVSLPTKQTDPTDLPACPDGAFWQSTTHGYTDETGRVSLPTKGDDTDG